MALANWRALVLAIGACSSLTSGCASMPARGALTPTHDHWLPGYVLGIWGRAELDVRDDCPDTGAASMRVGSTWRTLAVTLLTLGIYTPREAQIRCRAAP